MIANGVKETTSTTGTGTLTLTAAAGFARFAQAFAVGSLVDYGIKDGDSWEWGVGRVGAGNTLERTLVTATFTGGVYSRNPASPLSLSGSAEVVCTAHADTGGIGRGGGSLYRTPQCVLSAHHVKTTNNEATAGYALVANRLHWFPFVWPPGVDRWASGIRYKAFNTGGTKARVAIVEPGNPASASRIVAQTGDISTTSSGIKTATFAAPVALPLARYYITVLCDGGPQLVAGHAGLMDPYILQADGSMWPRGGSAHNIAAGWSAITDAMVQAGAPDHGEDRTIQDPLIAMVQG